MKYLHSKVFIISLLPLVGWLFASLSAPNADDARMIRRIFDEGMTNAQCYENLRVLCKQVGHRLSGSPSAEKAVVWGQNTMKTTGADTTFLQPVMVPHWVRGEAAQCELWVGKKNYGKLEVLALGGSVGTPPAGVSAEVIEVHRFSQLDSLGKSKIEGKIVFFNRAFPPTTINGFAAYGACVDQRSDGASQAAKYGAVAVLVRSMTHALDHYPHTGVMRYTGPDSIPAAAISTLSARRLHDSLATGKPVKVKLRLLCKNLPDAPSHNVVGELRGSQFPNEYIVVGGHLDSWDVGEGAHDDGAGVVQSMEALRILKAIGYQPRHSIRAVLFMNEENGARGAVEYANQANIRNEKHVYAIESDRGGFVPRGFAVQDTGAFLREVQQWAALFEPYGMAEIVTGHGGVDIGPLAKNGTKLIGLVPDSQRYFDHHHAQADVFESVHKRELELGAAGLAALIYLLDQREK